MSAIWCYITPDEARPRHLKFRNLALNTAVCGIPLLTVMWRKISLVSLFVFAVIAIVSAVF